MSPGKGCHTFFVCVDSTRFFEGIFPGKVAAFFLCGVNLVSEGILPGKGCQTLFVWAQSSL